MENEGKALQDLRWEVEREAEKKGEDYECTCPDPSEWSREKCEDFLEERE